MYSDERQKTRLEEVSKYISNGWKIFPVKHKGKKPLTKHGVKDASDDPRPFIQTCNIGLATGEPSGVSVVDIDDPDDLAKLEAKFGKLPKTSISRTGRDGGGFHYYFQHDERWNNVKNSTKIEGLDIDIRSTGGYVILPPSVHETGESYKWVISPEECEPATAPQWLVDLLPMHEKEPSSKSLEASSNDAPQETTESDVLTIERARTEKDRAILYLQKVPPAIAGDDGHGHTFSTVCRLVELFSLNQTELIEALEGWNETCDPPWSYKELKHKVKEAMKNTSYGGGETLSEENCPIDKPLRLDGKALHGLTGDIIQSIDPHTEADPVAILLTFVTVFGSLAGRKPYFLVEGSRHHCNLFINLVGTSSRARKGTSLGQVRRLMDGVNEVTGLSSGEGLISHVKDGETDIEDGVIQTTGGVKDKRTLVVESEFARTLKAMSRESSTLSSVLRDAWDTGDLSILTKQPVKATGAHISIVSHITTVELRKSLKDSDVHNGFGNRFLWASVSRSKLLPDGGDLSDETLDRLRGRVLDALDFASSVERMRRSDDCASLWREVYPDLVQEKNGIVYDAITSRAEAQVLRLSMIYALLDQSPIIETVHLEAALALWDYCDESARVIFGSVEGDSLSQKIRDLVFSRPGIKRSELSKSISHGVKKADFDEALQDLIRRDVIIEIPIYDKRQATTYYPSGGIGNRNLRTETETKKPNPLIPNSLTPEPILGAPSETGGKLLTAKKAASIADLLDWRNQHGAGFFKREDGSIWVTTEEDLTDSLRESISQNQETLSVFVSIPTSETVIEKDVFLNELLDMTADKPSIKIVDDEGWNKDFFRQVDELQSS
jgi:hypothetical protein